MTTALNYPSDLRGPLTSRAKTQSSKIAVTSPLSGNPYVQKLSTDAPVTYDFSFIFTTPDEAIYFRAWVESNNITGGVPFNISLNTEGSFGNGGNETQEVRFIPNSGDLLSNTSLNIGVFTYSAKFLCRKELTGLEDYYDLIGGGGLDLIRNMALIDIAINQKMPKGE